ncbi:MAG: DNA recombination protein RmuC [Chitinivibrionales bacterium]|nr:DNA recombination protein RmuC [Chitinivibrionales bacterium]
MELTPLFIGIAIGATAATALTWLILSQVLSSRYQNALAELNQQLAGSRERSALHEQSLNTLREELAVRERRIKELSDAKSSLEIQLSEIQTRLDSERRHHAEKLELLEKSEERLTTEFQNLANKIFDEKTTRFSAQSKEQLDAILKPFKEQMGDFKKKVEDVYVNESNQRSSLLTEIKHLKELNQQISVEALNLTNALKGGSKIQGNWGEMVLERVLEASGLQKGREYDVQVAINDENGKRFIPDVIVHLPDRKDIIVDSKVSLLAYEHFSSAQTDEARQAAGKAHLNSLKTHIDALSRKKYDALANVNSLDFVLMFVPIEAALATALHIDNHLMDDAFKKRILLVSPSTLLATLRTIQNMWQYDLQNRHAVEIAERAGRLYDKFVAFIESMQTLGSQLDKTGQTWQEAMKRLSAGPGNLVRRTEELRKLGIKARKSLPADIVLTAVEQESVDEDV